MRSAASFFATVRLRELQIIMSTLSKLHAVEVCKDQPKVQCELGRLDNNTNNRQKAKRVWVEEADVSLVSGALISWEIMFGGMDSPRSAKFRTFNAYSSSKGRRNAATRGDLFPHRTEGGKLR